MAYYEQERGRILQIVDAHSSEPVRPEFSTPAARLIVRRCEVLKRPVPLVIQRFLDRADGPKNGEGVKDKMARDFFRKGYAELPENHKMQVEDLHSAMFNPAFPHPYFKSGLTFAEAHSLLLDTYREESKRDLPKELQAAMIDFRSGLEKDISESAKLHRFWPEYSKATQDLQIATAGPHRINQSIPIVAARR